MQEPAIARPPPAPEAHDPDPARKQSLYIVLSAVFLTNALVAEFIGGKLFVIPTPVLDFTLSVGVILWPVVFLMTDVVNEYFGRVGVRRLSIIGACMIAYAYVALWIARLVPTVGFSPVKQDAFDQVFFNSQAIIVGSITAFLVAQLLDVTVFTFVKSKTGDRLLWARATGSTVVSQLIDTFIVQFIGLHMPTWFGNPGLDFSQFLNSALTGYGFKVMVAIAITPLLYLAHLGIDAYLRKK